MVGGNHLPAYLHDPELIISAIKVFVLGAFSFIVAIFFSSPFIDFLYRHKLWKKQAREKSIDGKDLLVFRKFHLEGETKVPRLGGILI